MNENSSVQEEESNNIMSKTGYNSKQSQRGFPKFKESREMSRFSEKFRELFNKEELMVEVDEMIVAQIEDSEKSIYNSIQELNDTLTQLIKDSVSDSLISLKSELQEEIKLVQDEANSNFENQNIERERLENKLYEIRSELVKADKMTYDKISEINTNIHESIDQTLNDMKNMETTVLDTMNNIKRQVNYDNERISLKLDKISELSEIIDKRVRREKSDVEIEMRNTFGKIASNEEKIKELTQYDNRIGNILVRILEFLKITAEWNIHEEEAFTESNDTIIPQSNPSSPVRRGNKMSPTNAAKMLNEDLLKQINLNNFPPILGSSNRINKTMADSISLRESPQGKNQNPVRIVYPPIEYNDLILTKIQVYKICESLLFDCSKYLENNLFDEKTNMIIAATSNEVIEYDEELKSVFSLQKQNEAFSLALKHKDNKKFSFKKLPNSTKKKGKNNHTNSKKTLRPESSRKAHNRSVELKGIDVKEIPYENLKLIDKLQKSQLEILAPKQRSIIFKRSSISRSSMGTQDPKFLPSVKGKNNNLLQLNPGFPSIQQ